MQNAIIIAVVVILVLLAAYKLRKKLRDPMRQPTELISAVYAEYLGGSDVFGQKPASGRLSMSHDRILFERPYEDSILIPAEKIESVQSTEKYGNEKQRMGHFLVMKIEGVAEDLVFVIDDDRPWVEYFADKLKVA